MTFGKAPNFRSSPIATITALQRLNALHPNDIPKAASGKKKPVPLRPILTRRLQITPAPAPNPATPTDNSPTEATPPEPTPDDQPETTDSDTDTEPEPPLDPNRLRPSPWHPTAYLHPTHLPKKHKSNQARKRLENANRIRQLQNQPDTNPTPPPQKPAPHQPHTNLTSTATKKNLTTATDTPITQLQWNTGGGGLLTNFGPITDTINRYQPTVCHLEDTLIPKNSSAKVTLLLQTACPNYKVYHNNRDYDPDSDKIRSITTLIHISVDKYTTQIGMTAPEVAGRLLLFRIDIPDSHRPLYTANIYMPTAGERSPVKAALTEELD